MTLGPHWGIEENRKGLGIQFFEPINTKKVTINSNKVIVKKKQTNKQKMV